MVTTNPAVGRSGPNPLAALREEVARRRAAGQPLIDLSIGDPDEPTPEPRPTRPDAPLPCIAHELDTHRIDYVYHYFGLGCLAFDELPYVGVLTELLGRLATARHSASDLDTIVETRLGGLDFSARTASSCATH